MVGRCRGIVLIELAVGVALAVVVAAGFAVVLHGQALHVRLAYEERVARETASAELERIEADGFGGLAEGRTEIAVDPPGWENLVAPVCAVVVTPARDVAVEVAWTTLKGARKTVAVRAFGGGPP
jgi:hypothetical protein